jgi:hypothetical protein
MQYADISCPLIQLVNRSQQTPHFSFVALYLTVMAGDEVEAIFSIADQRS